MKNKFTILLSILTMTVFAQTPLSIADAIETALENNYGIKAAEQAVAIAKNNNNYKTAGRFPTVNLSAALNNSTTAQNNPASFISEATFLNSALTLGGDIAYTLWDGGRIEVSKQQLESLQRQSEGEVKSQIEQTTQQVLAAYNQALIAKAQIEVIEEVLSLSNSRIAYEKVKQAFGQATKFNILQTEDAFLTDSIAYVNAVLTYENAIRNLNFTIGEDDFERPYELIDPLVADDFENYTFEDLQQKMFANNQTIKNLYTNLGLNQINTNLQKTSLKPVVSLNAGLNLDGGLFKLFGDDQNGDPFEIQNSGTVRAYANVSATWNVFNGGNVKRAIQNAEIQENITTINIDQTKRTLSSQLASTLANYTNLIQLLSLNNQRIEIAKQNLGIAQERFRGGQITSFDYRTIQLAYINANQTRLNTIFNIKNTEINLRLLAGDLVK